MPELPEVETVRRGLAPVLEGRMIVAATQNRADLRWPLPERFAARLTGRRILRLGRRAKYLTVDLDADDRGTPETVLIHLGMSGRLLLSGLGDDTAKQGAQFHYAAAVGEAARKHDHVVLDLGDGIGLVYNDARRFGSMDLWPTARLAEHRLLSALGPEPLSNDFNGAALAAGLASRSTSVKSALLDQRQVAGLGNIYVCEVLYRAGISPRREACSLTAIECERVTAMIRDVLTEAIEAGGSSLRDFHGAGGELGYFQHRFSVYDREGDRCGNPPCSAVIERIVQSGRSTFFCPHCQT